MIPMISVVLKCHAKKQLFSAYEKFRSFGMGLDESNLSPLAPQPKKSS